MWTKPPTSAQIDTLEAAGRKLSQSRPGGVALFNVVTGQSRPAFDDDVRKSTQRATQTEVFSLAVAHLVLSTGLVGTAVRAFMSTMILTGRPAAPTKVFDDGEASAAWLAEQLGEHDARWTRERLTNLLREAVESVQS